MRGYFAMKCLYAVTLICAFSQASVAFADTNVYGGPLFMCPDAHGVEQKALFKIIDISRMPMRIEGMGKRRIDGFAASIDASRETGFLDNDPFDAASKRLNSITTTLGDFDRRLVEVCFATQPPPPTDVDGPFLYMPGYFVDAPTTSVLAPLDTIVVPEQIYLVMSYDGPRAEIGDMRFTLTEEFWPKVAPYLGLERAVGPNMMIYAPGYKGTEDRVSLEMWTPIKPYNIVPR